MTTRTASFQVDAETVPAPAHGIAASTAIAVPPSDADPGVVFEGTTYTRDTVYTRATTYMVSAGHVVNLMRVFWNGSLIVRPYDSEVPAL